MHELYELKEKLSECFRDFEPFLNDCKFTSCTHTKESGCGIIEAVKRREIEESRHKSYVELFEEMKDLKPWEAKKHKKN